MKLYEKIIDGKHQRKSANKIIIIKDGMQIFNPTEEMLLEDGWIEYIVPIHESTEEELFNSEKQHIINEIRMYDYSPEVNGFYVGEFEMWLDKATRVGLKLRFEAEIDSGKTDTILWYNGKQFPLELAKAVKMLNAIELYASQCYDNTQRHLYIVNTLTDMDELKNYDYKSGYPTKLQF